MNVILDLDGTIVFPEPAEIPIPGRSRATYLSAATADLLRQIGELSQLYIATARSAASVKRLVSSLPEVAFAGFVLECGLVQRSRIAAQSTASREQLALTSHLKFALPDWEHVEGYEQMVCCIAPRSIPNPLEELKCCIQRSATAQAWLFHQERHKSFAYPAALCKVAGLQRLGVEQLDFAAGDDFRYDGSLLDRASYSLTLSSADPELIQQVTARAGFVTTESGHVGAVELLSEIYRQLKLVCLDNEKAGAK